MKIKGLWHITTKGKISWKSSLQVGMDWWKGKKTRQRWKHTRRLPYNGTMAEKEDKKEDYDEEERKKERKKERK